MATTQLRGSSQILSVSIDKTRVDSTIIRADGVNAFTADQSHGGFKLTNLGTPTTANDGVNKAYADSLKAGLSIKDPMRAATTAALPANTRTGNVLTASANAALPAQDGVTLLINERLMVKDEATGANNGFYFVSAVGSAGAPWTLTRTDDADTSAEVVDGSAAWVSEGTANGNKRFTQTANGPITLNTTALVFTQDSGGGSTYVGGAGITESGTTFNVTAADNSLTVNANDMLVKRDGTSIELTAAGLKVNAAKFVTREPPTGTVNGVNTTFTLAGTPITGTEQVFLNGILQEPGAGNDYTISGGSITYLTAPATGDRLRVTYMIA